MDINQNHINLHTYYVVNKQKLYLKVIFDKPIKLRVVRAIISLSENLKYV
jgi:hypothetical protein